MVDVKFRRIHTDALLPTYAHESDAGMDCYLPVTYQPLSPGEIRILPLGFQVEIPDGFELQVRSRSGLASRGIIVANSPGTIDASFRGEVGVILMNVSGAIQPLERHFRVAQMVLAQVPKCNWEIVDELNFSERGDGGYGSTGE